MGLRSGVGLRKGSAVVFGIEYGDRLQTPPVEVPSPPSPGPHNSLIISSPANHPRDTRPWAPKPTGNVNGGAGERRPHQKACQWAKLTWCPFYLLAATVHAWAHSWCASALGGV